MSAHGYQAPPDIVAEARDDIDRYLSMSRDVTATQEDRCEGAGLALELLAAIEDLGAVPPKIELPPQLVHSSLAAVTAETLQACADTALSTLLAALRAAWEPDEQTAATAELEAGLLARQRAARRLRGAEIAGFSAAYSADQTDAIALFDQTIRPLVWAMSFANPMREGHALLIQPGRRRQSWWWTEALDVEWETVRRTDEFAELLKRYPSFSRHVSAARDAVGLRLRAGVSAEASSDDARPETQLDLAASATVEGDAGREQPVRFVDGTEVISYRDAQGEWRVQVKEPARCSGAGLTLTWTESGQSRRSPFEETESGIFECKVPSSLDRLPGLELVTPDGSWRRS